MALAFAVAATQLSAQISAVKSHLDQFNVSCETHWNGHGWDRCESGHVTAESSFDATFCLTAPACDEHCYASGPHNSASRYGFLKRTDQANPIREMNCPGSPEEQPPYTCPECCVTHHWQTTGGVAYYLIADNLMTRQSCGPTKARFERGTFNCVFE